MGVTANDPGDSDTGANKLQNFPVISSATLTNTNTTIQGTLNSTANSTFTIEFFSNSACDASGNGEGATFIGSTSVTTNGSGNASFNVTLATLAPGQRITATTTDATGNTSEFSACALVVCGYQISPNSAFFPVNGGEAGFNLTTALGCTWTGISNDSWIELTSGNTGAGSAAISYRVSDNFSFVPRQGTISIGGQTFTVTQDSETAPDCRFAISPISTSFAVGGGTGSIAVFAEGRCAWQAVSNASWITITSGCCAIGNGSVTYSVAANPNPSGRAGTIVIGGKTFNVKQKGN